MIFCFLDHLLLETSGVDLLLQETEVLHLAITIEPTAILVPHHLGEWLKFFSEAM